MDAISGLFRSVIWNETIPDRLRGRLAGVEMISYTSGPTLGNFEAGALASVVGVRASVVSGGVMCVVGTGVILAFLPAFWRYDARRSARMTFPLAHETWFESGHRDLDWSFAGETATLLLLAGAVLVTLAVRALSHVRDGVDVPFLARMAPWMPFAVRMHLAVSLIGLLSLGRLPVAGDGPRGEPAGDPARGQHGDRRRS